MNFGQHRLELEKEMGRQHQRDLIEAAARRHAGAYRASGGRAPKARPWRALLAWFRAR